MSDDFDIQASRAVAPHFYRAPVPEGKTPYEFQLAGVEYHLARDHAIFGDAPRLGKTIECVLLGNAIRAKRTLVICPASLRLNWEREIQSWSTIRNLQTYPVLAARDGVSHRAHYVITSYAMILNKDILAAILDLKWDHLILDEAHALKDPKGNKRTRIICAPDMLPSVIGRITMATGTLMPNQPIECYNAVRLLDWGAIDRASVNDFRNYYYDYGEGMVMGRIFDPKTQSTVYKAHWSDRVRNVPRNLGNLQERLRKNVMVRRLQEQVLHELPTKQWHMFPLEPTAGIRKALAHPGWGKVEKLYELDPDEFHRGAPIDGEVSTARRLLGEAKAPAVAAYARDLLESGISKLIIGAWHHTVLDILLEQLEDLGVVYMDGGTTTVAKQRAVDQFQENPKIRIILGQMMPLSEGWTLHAAQDVLLPEPDWVPGRNEQLLERPSGIGQEGDYILGHIPVVPGSLDERIVGRAIEKDQSIYQALDKI